MNSKPGKELPSYVRRQDRAIQDQGWIRSFLHRSPIGYLASVHEGQPYINSNLFLFDEQRHAIYLHTARLGRTRTNVEEDARVCFTVSEMGRLLPAEEALEFSVEYAGVTVFGCAAVVADATEKSNALQNLLDKYFPHLKPGEHYRSITPDELERTSVYRLDIESWSGKQKTETPDFPGAFFLESEDGS